MDKSKNSEVKYNEKKKIFNGDAHLVGIILSLNHSTNSCTNESKTFLQIRRSCNDESKLGSFAAPSINDFDDVAFAGRRTPGGGTVFLSEIGQPNVNLMPGLSTSPNQFVAGRVQINNSKQVIQHSFVSGTNPAQNFLRRINGVDNFTLIAAANGAGPFNDFDQIYPGSISLNNFGEAVFLTRQGNNTTILTTGERPNFSTLQFPSTGDSLRPIISDCGCVVVRAGANQTDPIRLYSNDFTNFETIAGTSDGFTAIGQSPSISNLCDVIVFYGDLNAAGATTLGTNPGPGMFASIEISETQRRIVRLAGRLIEDNAAPGGNDDGFCDTGETCIQGELGFTQSGNPIFFNSFDTFNRVAVTHQAIGATGIEDDIFVVSFLGTPNIASDTPARPFTNQPGLWTLTTQIKNENGVLREKPLAAVPVVQIGDVINTRTVTNINVYDQIANVRLPNSTAESPGDHRLAFHVTTNNGNMIIRANRNVETPVIFIPGILGSTLVEGNTERWIGLGAGLLTGANLDRLLFSQNPLPTIVATDVIRQVSTPVRTFDFYEPMLESLMMPGGLREYQVEGIPARRTFAGCDLSQQLQNPTLFVFAYDWRLSNIENATKLKDYVRCVQRFYPETEVDIVTHSMGGLLARRYIAANLNNHSVRKLVTIAAPFLGAPRALETIETGRLRFAPDFLDRRIPNFLTNRIKTLARDSKSVHELFPSNAYFTLGGTPFVEETFDINGDGIVPEVYNYSQTFNFFNPRFSSAPYTNNETFHGFAGQDDWRLDTSGVEYFHIFGIRNRRDTVEQIIATPTVRQPPSIIRQDFSFDVRKGLGDKTVPRLSAERISAVSNFNFPNATLRAYVSASRAQNALYEHSGLVKAPEVRDQVLTYLELPFQPSVANLSQQNGGNQMPSYEYKANSGFNLDAVLPPMAESYYVTIVGVDRLDITDDLGNINTPIGDQGFELAVPDVSYSGGLYSDVVNVGYHGLDMPAEEGEYTIKFRTGSDSIDIKILKGERDDSPNLAIRYIDLVLPANVECLLTFNPQGVPDLRYDSNGDGTFDTVVPAHVRVSGTAAQDITAPSVIISQDNGQFGTGLVTINAADTQSGVRIIYYRFLGDTSFQIYTEPFSPPNLPRNSQFKIEAFADDNVGNRSSPIQKTVTNALIY